MNEHKLFQCWKTMTLTLWCCSVVFIDSSFFIYIGMAQSLLKVLALVTWTQKSWTWSKKIKWSWKNSHTFTVYVKNTCIGNKWEAHFKQWKHLVLRPNKILQIMMIFLWYQPQMRNTTCFGKYRFHFKFENSIFVLFFYMHFFFTKQKLKSVLQSI